MTQDRAVGLVIENSPDFIIQALAIWRRGGIVVPLRSVDDQYRINISHVEEVVTALPGSGWIDATFDMRSDDSRAQILFTSGTEGEPKGVALTHKNLADVVTRLNRVMKVTSDIREYVGIPVAHSFGFGRCRAVLAAGGRAFISARGFNPVEINTMLEAGEINAISAVPSLWRILIQSGSISKRASKQVRWIEIGSQHMSGSEKIALRELFAEAVIVQHYGLTEASRSTFLEVNSVPAEHLVSVGKPFGETEVQIANDGRIMIRGPNVSNCILLKGETIDPRDQDAWLTTNDLGEIRDGLLHYKGRADDVINFGGLKISPDSMESEIRVLLNTKGDFAVCRIPSALSGDGILIVATPEVLANDAEILDAAVLAATKFGVSARGSTHMMRLSALQRTENGKIKRKPLTDAYVKQQQALPQAPLSKGSNSLRSQLGTILGVTKVRDEDTFINLGGDSLRYIQASVILEKQLGFLPPDWEKLKFVELESLSPRKSGLSQMEPSVILRAIAIISVVVNHAGVFKSLFPIDGAAFMLLLPAGYSFARFQLQRVIETGRARMALAALPRIILPAVLLIAIQQLRHREFEPSALFLFNNFLNVPGVFSYWFIEVFVQIHLIIAVLLLSKWVRTNLRDHAWQTSFAALIISAAISTLTPLAWNTDHLYNRVPHYVLWYFFLGWCLLFASNGWQRWVNSAAIIAIGFALGIANAQPDSRAVWIVFGGMFLNWVPTLSLPSAVVRSVSVLASASLYIYTSHFLVLEPIAKIFPKSGFAGPVVASLAAGIVFWYLVEKVWQLSARQLQRH